MALNLQKETVVKLVEKLEEVKGGNQERGGSFDHATSGKKRSFDHATSGARSFKHDTSNH